MTSPWVRLDAVEEITKQGERFCLPATSQFLGKSALDKEEKAGKKDVSFLYGKAPKRRQKRQNPDGVQGDWRSLESSLVAEAGKSYSSSVVQAGSEVADWHEIPEIRMTPELEKDLRIIENRGHLDPKRFYKSAGTGRKKGELPTRVHFGTVVTGAHEFYSGRLTKKERRKSILEEVMSDQRIMKYTKNKFKTLQQAKQVKRRVVDPASRKGGKSGSW